MIILGCRARFLVSMALASIAFCANAAELPAPPAGLTALSKPMHIPDFNLPKPAGGTVHADDFRGKVLIARFWATW